MTLQDKAKVLYDLRQKIGSLEAEHEKAIDPLKVQRDILQAEILKDMNEQGQFSARYDFCTITRAVRKSLQVIDEKLVIEYLKKKKLAPEYVSERLNENFKSYATQLVKENVAIDGTSVKEHEYISIRESDEKKDKRKIVTQ